MPAGKRISPHTVRLESAVDGEWRTAAEVAARAQVSRRTASQFLSDMTLAKCVEMRATWPAYSYRLKR